MKNPEFTIFTGPMFSSKTTKLLLTLERYKYQNKVVLTVKPMLDRRYAIGEIVSHSDWRAPAELVETGKDILSKVENLSLPADVVAVDEAFMINGCADALIWLFKQGVSIVVSTLDISATGKVFNELRDMLPWATHIEKCTAICTVCGQNAPYTHRKGEFSGEIQVGGDETYEPRCFEHHVSINDRDR